jgi:hypothetical protein
MKSQISTMAVSMLFAATTAAFASVEISSKPTQNVTCGSGVCSATAKKAVLNAADRDGMLSSGDVTVSSGSIAKDIDVKAPLSWSIASRLTLDAYRSIAFERPVVALSGGGLTIMTDDGGTGGDFTFTGGGHVEFKAMSSSLAINGHAYMLVFSIKNLMQYARNPFVYMALAKNLDISRRTFTQSPVKNFEGVFEGLGHTISGLTINDTVEGDVVGLFRIAGSAEQATAIRDVDLTAVNIHAFSGCVGTLAGALSYAQVLHDTTSGQITVTSDGDFDVGGLACSNTGTISQSHAAVAITVTGTAGGVEGGLAGINEGYCFEGACSGLIDESYSTSIISGADGSMAGGLVGQNLGGLISNSYSTATASTGSGRFSGGLIGSNENNKSEQTDPVITNVYSTGAVSGGSGSTLGGLIGQDLADPGINNAYWDLDTSGIANPAQGAGNISNDAGITGLTTTQFQSGLPTGFDPSVWALSPGTNSGYPYLLANPPPK